MFGSIREHLGHEDYAIEIIMDDLSITREQAKLMYDSWEKKFEQTGNASILSSFFSVPISAYAMYLRKQEVKKREALDFDEWFTEEYQEEDYDGVL